MSRSRQVVLVIAPETLIQSRAARVPPDPRAVQSSATTSTHNEAHNKVERRRKDRIRRSVEQLSETLKPPCHCGKTTTAEILEKVISQITSLQRENEDLRQRIERLSCPSTASPCTDPHLNSRFVDLLLEQVLLKAKVLEHQEVSGDGRVSMTNTQVAMDTFTMPEVQHIGREEETWGEEGDPGESRNADGEGPRLVISGSENESSQQRIESVCAEQQSWPVSSLLTLSNNPKPRNEDQNEHPKTWNDGPTFLDETPQPRNGTSKHPYADPNPGPWTEVEPVPAAATPPCTLVSRHHGRHGQPANSGSTIDHLPNLHYFSVATSRPLPSGPTPFSTLPSGSAIGDTSVRPEALRATLPSTTAGSIPAPSLSLVNPPQTSTYPSQVCTTTGHHPQSFPPPAIVQPWVDTSSDSRCLRHHPPFSSGSPQAQDSSAGYFDQQRNLTVRAHPQTTCAATSVGTRSRHNEDPPSCRARRFLRFRPYQPASHSPMGAGGAESHTGRHHSARNYRLTIHPPLTASDFPRSPPPVSRQRFYLIDSYGSSGSLAEHGYCNGAHLPPHSPPPPYSERPFPHLQQPSPSLPSSSHPPYPPYPPPPALQTQNATVWRPYSERPRGSGFCLADIISLPPSETGEDGGLAPPPVPPPTTNSGRTPSFLVDHLLDHASNFNPP